VIAVLLVLTMKYPSKYTVIPLIFFFLYFLMDTINIVKIRRKAAQDPAFLDQKLKL
jgi:hypothetical protein